MESRIARGLVLLALWVFVGTVLSLELYFNARVTMQHVDFLDTAITQFGRAAMWAALVPFILQLRERMPLRRGRWLGGTLFHFAAGFLVMAVSYLGRLFVYMLLEGHPLGEFWAT